jgi:hypothetical protein
MFTINSEVMSEEDVASEIEERERSFGIQRILDNIERNVVSDADLDPELTCSWCDSLIPIGRQKIVLSMANSCDYCVDCQTIIDRRERVYA